MATKENQKKNKEDEASAKAKHLESIGVFIVDYTNGKRLPRTVYQALSALQPSSSHTTGLMKQLYYHATISALDRKTHKEEILAIQDDLKGRKHTGGLTENSKMELDNACEEILKELERKSKKKVRNENLENFPMKNLLAAWERFKEDKEHWNSEKGKKKKPRKKKERFDILDLDPSSDDSNDDSIGQRKASRKESSEEEDDEDEEEEEEEGDGVDSFAEEAPATSNDPLADTGSKVKEEPKSKMEPKTIQKPINQKPMNKEAKKDMERQEPKGPKNKASSSEEESSEFDDEDEEDESSSDEDFSDWKRSLKQYPSNATKEGMNSPRPTKKVPEKEKEKKRAPVQKEDRIHKRKREEIEYEDPSSSDEKLIVKKKAKTNEGHGGNKKGSHPNKEATPLRKFFSEEEDDNLYMGYALYANSNNEWATILSKFSFDPKRTSVGLKDRWRTLEKTNPDHLKKWRLTYDHLKAALKRGEATLEMAEKALRKGERIPKEANEKKQKKDSESEEEEDQGDEDDEESSDGSNGYQASDF